MARTLVYYAHPGNRHSTVNRDMIAAARRTAGIAVVDLYAEYPRFEINIDREQRRLLEHEVIVFQFPMFWYSTPSLLKEWIDLVLEHGFAYGDHGDRLAGKVALLALTAAGPAEAYAPDGYQKFPLRTFLTPLERTFGLCQMRFPAPYVLFGALKARADGRSEPHIEGYRRLLAALRDDRFDVEAALARELIDSGSLPIHPEN